MCGARENLGIGLALLCASIEQILGVCVFPALELRQKVDGEDMTDDAGHQEVDLLALKFPLELVHVEGSPVRCGLNVW